MISRLGLFGLLVGLGLSFAGCSGSVDFSFGSETPAEAAVDLIESDAMVQRLGLDAISNADCDDPTAEDPGEIFGCTAETNGQKVTFEVTIEDEAKIFAAATNVVNSSGLTRLEQSAVQGLNRENGLTLPDDAMDCGDRSVVLDENRQMLCVLRDPNGSVFDAAITVTDIDTGAFSVEIVAER